MFLGLLFFILSSIWMIVSWFIASLILKPITDKIDPYGILGLLGIFATLALTVGIGIPGVGFLKYVFSNLFGLFN